MIIVSTPKVAGTSRWQESRSICLCNVSSKIISKVLANRLNILLLKLIASSQSGFIPGQSICDNIMLAQELMLDLNK